MEYFLGQCGAACGAGLERYGWVHLMAARSASAPTVAKHHELCSMTLRTAFLEKHDGIEELPGPAPVLADSVEEFESATDGWSVNMVKTGLRQTGGIRCALREFCDHGADF